MICWSGYLATSGGSSMPVTAHTLPHLVLYCALKSTVHYYYLLKKMEEGEILFFILMMTYEADIIVRVHVVTVVPSIAGDVWWRWWWYDDASIQLLLPEERKVIVLVFCHHLTIWWWYWYASAYSSWSSIDEMGQKTDFFLLCIVIHCHDMPSILQPFWYYFQPIPYSLMDDSSHNSSWW